jgi:mannose-6-phosphate isomerase-like protein (cupin superfamily)
MRKNEPSRREILLGALAALPAGVATASGPASASPAPVRRLVTGVDHDGHSAVLSANAGANTVELNGSRITRLWESDAVPAELPLLVDRAAADRGATAGNAYREGFRGTSLYVADIPAGNRNAIPMHREDSLDYIAVLSGEIDLVLETSTVTMRAGDVLVQGGNLHTWVNRSKKSCRLLVVVLRATPNQ